MPKGSDKMIEWMYYPDSSDFIDPAYDPPPYFEYAKWHKVASFPGQYGGPDVEVYESRLPAQFYQVRWDGNVVSTASSSESGKVAFVIARSLANRTIEWPG